MPYSFNRRNALKLALGSFCSLISVPVFSSQKSSKLRLTPTQTAGPFYPVKDQPDKDRDLIQIEGRSHKAAGKPIVVRGSVTDDEGNPVSDLFIEIWHANKWGRYDHPRDRNSAPLDQNFQGWGQMRTDKSGSYAFDTIFPGIYPAAPNWNRPPHIHFRLRKQGYRELITQMYFPDEALNHHDLILQALSAPNQQAVTAEPKGSVQQEGEVFTIYQFNIVVQKF